MISKKLPDYLLLLVIAVLLYARTLNQTHPFPVYDEVDYLNMARDYAEQGTMQILKSYLSGQNRESNRHPLYLWNLSLLMDNTPRDFTRGKLLSLAHVTILILAAYFFSRRRWGRSVALFSAAAMGFSPTSVTLSDSIAADPLFTIFYFSATMVITESKDNLKNWALFGVLCGLAYMTKGNGYFLFFAALAVGLWRYRKRFFVRPHLYVSLAGFLLVSFVLITRNLIVWHAPFYHYNNKVFWLDSWNQAVVFQNSPLWEKIGWRWYLQTHTFSQTIGRVSHGLIRTSNVLLQALAIGPSNTPGMMATGFLVFSLAIIGLISRWREGHAIELLGFSVTGSILLLAFVWGALGDLSHVRYLFPIAVTLFPMAAIGTEGLARRRIKNNFPGHSILQLCIGGIAIFCIAVNWNGMRVNPLNTWSVSSNWKKTSLWLQSHVDENGYIFDNFSVYSPWDCCRIKMVPYPFSVPPEVLNAAIRERNVHYALVDSHRLSEDPFKEKYGPADEYGPPSLLNWPRCFHTDTKPSVFLIYSPFCSDRKKIPEATRATRSLPSNNPRNGSETLK